MDPIVALSPDGRVGHVAIAVALGLFLGLEREWSNRAAGVRTFALISLVGAVFATLERPGLVVVGAALVATQGVLLAVRGVLDDATEGLSLTTAVSMLVAYGVGVLAGLGQRFIAVTVAVLAALLLVSKRELHDFAGGLTRQELRSAAEFSILAFVAFPLLPSGVVEVETALGPVTVEPRIVWLLVVTVAAIGIVNYAILQTVDGRGLAVTGFLGGLASSTAVVGTMVDQVGGGGDDGNYALAAVLLADAAMALRNLAIAVGFTLAAPVEVLVGAVLPLGAVILGAVAMAGAVGDWSAAVPVELESPFSLRNVLAFGGVFAVILVVGGLAAGTLGTAGLYVTAVLSGLVSSAGVTASAVSLYRTGAIAAPAAITAILLATAASIVVKVALTAVGPDRRFARRVTIYSGVLVVAASGATAVAVL